MNIKNKKIKKKKNIKNKNKKSQVKIQEMAFVLVAVVFLFALLFLFFARFQYSQLQKTASETRELRTITMLEVVASLPELRCSKSFGSATETACIDKDKVMAFSDPNIQEKYEKIWKAASIVKVTIEEVYPKGDSYVIYEKSNPSSTIAYATYIPLCEETANLKCVIGKIKITTEVP